MIRPSSACFEWHERILPSRLAKMNDLLSLYDESLSVFDMHECNLPVMDFHDRDWLVSNTKEFVCDTRANSGGSFKMYDGNLCKSNLVLPDTYSNSVPLQGYCVAVHPELGTWIPADATEEEIAICIETYVLRNADLLNDSENLYFGTWVSDDPDTFGMISLDISAVIRDKDTAIRLGKAFDQQAIFDLSTFEPIDCGGSGVSPLTGEILMETDVAHNYLSLCMDYYNKSFESGEKTFIEEIAAEKYMNENVLPCVYGLEFNDVKQFLPQDFSEMRTHNHNERHDALSYFDDFDAIFEDNAISSDIAIDHTKY